MQFLRQTVPTPANSTNTTKAALFALKVRRCLQSAASFVRLLGWTMMDIVWHNPRDFGGSQNSPHLSLFGIETTTVVMHIVKLFLGTISTWITINHRMKTYKHNFTILYSFSLLYQTSFTDNLTWRITVVDRNSGTRYAGSSPGSNAIKSSDHMPSCGSP